MFMPIARVLVCTLAAIAAGSLRAQAQIQVGRNVQISKANIALHHTEVLADADPSNPSRMVACTHMHHADRGEIGVVVYISHDGGGSWRPTLEEYPFNDPTCTYAAD